MKLCGTRVYNCWRKGQGVALQIKRWFGELFDGYSIKGSMWGYGDFDI